MTPPLLRGTVLAVMMLVSGAALGQGEQAAPAGGPTGGPTGGPVAGPTLRVGDSAPALVVESWLAGEPVTVFAPGRVYVVEFWATWCGPCVAAMPRLSSLQVAYREKGVAVIGVNVWEEDPYTAETEGKVRAFVERRASRMAYAVAYDGGAKGTETAWLKAAGRTVIPTTFVVDRAGKVAWIGHPNALDYVVEEVVEGRWNAKDGPAKIKAAYAALTGACEKYREGFEAGEAAWAEAVKAAPSLAGPYREKRYAAMVAAGHEERAYALGREMLAEAMTTQNAAGLMGIVLPLMDPEHPVKRLDRGLVQEVSEALVVLGNDGEAGQHVCLMRVDLLLGNTERARTHRARALELTPEANRAGMERWLTELEGGAKK